MNRRGFITLLGGAAAWPLVARAQQGERMRRIGALVGDSETDPFTNIKLSVFTKGLAELGWISEQNLRIDIHWAAGDLERIKTYAKDLVSLRPDPVVLDAAGLFAEKDRYHDDLLARIERGSEISPNLHVEHWSDFDELASKLTSHLNALLNKQIKDGDANVSPQVLLNRLFNLHDEGFVKEHDGRTLKIQSWQAITPHRPGVGGALSLNRLLRDLHRQVAAAEVRRRSSSEVFLHSEKVIRTRNYYAFSNASKRVELTLSNGSIGIVCDNVRERRGYFPERQGYLKWKDLGDEDFELAYVITVHKSQGSEFDTVFVVLPSRRALMSRELVYTALTRSQGELRLFIERETPDRPSVLSHARQVSDVLPRNSSLLASPFDGRLLMEPEPGIRVKSKIDVEQVRQGIILTLRRSKTDQDGLGRKIGIPFGRTRWCPIASLQGWLAVSGITEGAIFRPVDRHGRIQPVRLSGEAVSLVVRERVAVAGLDPTKYSGHSLRAGLARSQCR
jgi:hypothetical protein